jgi:hypothetical protein
MKSSLMPRSASRPPSGAGRSADCGAGQRHHEDRTDQRAPQHPGHGAVRDRLKELVQLDPSAVVLDCNDSIPQLDQIFLLHGGRHLAHSLRLCFAWEFDDQKIGQG